MNVLKIVPDRKEFVRILIITTIIFPLFVLLRGKHHIMLVPFGRYLKEYIFLLISLLTITRSLYLFHYSVPKKIRALFKKPGHIAAEVVFITIVTAGTVAFWNILIFPELFRREGDLRFALFVLFINYFVAFTYLYYYHFMDSQEHFRQAVASQERLRYEKITAQYKSLQNHISPHFIFNCLGGLDNIIREKPDDASRLIYSLSDCLQHILVTLEKDTITLEEEKVFIQKYTELLKIRFQDGLTLSMEIEQSDYSKRIPPCMLQMLVENAVKHNYFDAQHKLEIKIATQPGNRLSVSNSCKPKTYERATVRIGTGLENIRQRLELLTDEKIGVEETKDKFTVYIPLLN